MSIAPGTLCYVIRTEPGNERMLGRVVEVIGPALPNPGRNGELMHLVDSEWLRVELPRHHCFARPSSLQPIAGPRDVPPVTGKRKPEFA